MSCPHCDSADVRPSRHSLGLHRIGLHRYRCRACGGLFWLRRGQVAAVRARRREYFEAPPGAQAALGPPPATGAPGEPLVGPPPGAPSGLARPPESLSGLDGPPDAPAPVVDLRALDQDLVRRRTQALPR